MQVGFDLMHVRRRQFEYWTMRRPCEQRVDLVARRAAGGLCAHRVVDSSVVVGWSNRGRRGCRQQCNLVSGAGASGQHWHPSGISAPPSFLNHRCSSFRLTPSTVRNKFLVPSDTHMQH